MQDVPAAASELKQTANLLYKKRSFPEANTIYESIIKIFNSEAPAEFIRTVRSNRAACLIELGQYQSAIEEIDILFQISSTSATFPTDKQTDPILLKAHFRKARCLFELERANEALKELNAYRDLADGKVDEAEAHLRTRILQQLQNSLSGDYTPPCGLTIPFVFRLNRQSGCSFGNTLEIINEPLPPMDLTDYNFVVNHSRQREALPLLAKVMKSLHEHSDWTALHAFFSQRHMLDRGPKLKSQCTSREYIIPVNVDTASVGLPDFYQKFEDGISAACSAMLGDPLPASIGPVLGMSIGMHIMDLCYRGKDPKGRTFGDWESLWKVIALWARQYDSARATNADITSYSTRGRPESEINPWDVKPEHIWTRGVEGAEAFAYAFSQITISPFNFRNWELDYISLMVSEEICVILEDRFPVNGPGDVYSGPKEAKACPETTRGDDWVAWSKTVRPGQILVPKTHFEAKWATVIVSNLNFGFIIKLRASPWSICIEPDTIYL